MSVSLRSLILCLISAVAVVRPPVARAGSPPLPRRPWNQDVIYFALTDRFYDGDPSNDVPAGCDPALYDKTQTDINRYQGGDFRGLELALKEGYFKALGITAIWITPPVRNVWCSPFDSDYKPKAGYHGYWAQDFLDIDPHLVSRRSLDGTREYPDTRDGRMQHYKDLVDLAHSQGIKIIQDIVCNHAGPVFYYDTNGDGHMDMDKNDWIVPFKRDGPHDDARWAELPKWDIHRTEPAKSLTILGHRVKLNGRFADIESYGRRGMSPDSLGKSDGEEIECDFFSLRDFWTAPDSPFFSKLVDDFVETYAFYAETIGVDGFRIDTVKHVHHGFWDAFTERLRKRLGPERAKQFILFGEVYDGNPKKIGEYTYRETWPKETGPCLDSLLNFKFCFAARSFLRTADKPFGKAGDVEDAFQSLLPVPPTDAQRPFYDPTPGSDGLNSEQKMVNFVENHDGMNRFRVEGISERRNLLANALLLTSPGIPCLYYGTETGLQDTRGKIGQDSETGRLTFVPAGEAGRFDTMQKSASFQTTAALIKLRESLPALVSGEASPLWIGGDGVFAFARDGAGVQPVVIVINASGEERVTSMKLASADGKPLFSRGDKLERIPIAGLDGPGAATAVVEVQGEDFIPEVELRIAPETVNLYRKMQ